MFKESKQIFDFIFTSDPFHRLFLVLKYSVNSKSGIIFKSSKKEGG